MERITKIAENNTIVETVNYDEKIGGAEIVAETQPYGQNRIDDEIDMAEAKKIEIESYDKELQLEIQQNKIDKLIQIQDKMAGLNAEIHFPITIPENQQLIFIDNVFLNATLTIIGKLIIN